MLGTVLADQLESYSILIKFKIDFFQLISLFRFIVFILVPLAFSFSYGKILVRILRCAEFLGAVFIRGMRLF